MKIRQNISLKEYTTLKIGGKASYFCQVSSKSQLIKALIFAQKKKLPYFILGGGSNLLISDQGFPGLVIKNEIRKVVGFKRLIKISSGMPLSTLVSLTIQKSLAGAEKLTSIPGTVGGAIFGNAGAYGQAAGDFLVKVIALDTEKNQQLVLTKKDCQFGYRDSIFKRKPYVILEVHFQFPLGDKKELLEAAKLIMLERVKKYPQNFQSPGSFFKNILAQDLPAKILVKIPPGKIIHGKIPAGFLLESVGAKGQRLNQIQVLPNHANFFVNLGQGKAADLYQLAQEQAEKVQKKFGIKLEPEVQFLNLLPFNS